MEIAAGTRLGPYEIVSRIGAGGMGEVWRATDTRLERSVAVKVLPREFAQNANLKSRFQREAKTISQLHHPHICTLFDVGHESGRDFLVMELIDGESLADRLARGALPLEQAVRYAIEIADALAKAHRHGIVHRDLKPGNIMITAGGAKLLDFGLAKNSLSASSGVFSGTTAFVEATEQKPLTAEGTIVGTLQYMAPEQLEGVDADARTDIFAFGAVIYEMVTGKRAFDGRTRTSVIAAIIDRDPQPVSSLQPSAPAPLDRVVSLCLRKNPDERWQSAHDVKLELEAIAAGEGAATAVRRGSSSRMGGWIAAAVLAALVLGAATMHMRTAHRPAPPERFMIAPAEKTAFDIEDSPVAVSPDGKNFVLFVHSEAGDELVVRSRESFEYRKIQSGSYDAFWSSDGRNVGFFKDGKMKRVSVNGGSAQTITTTGDSRGASWGSKGTIVYAPSATAAIFAVSAEGGPPRAVTKLDPSRKEIGHLRPYFLPDGRHFLFTALSSDPDFGAVWCGSLDSSERKRVLDLETTVVYADDHLLYVDGDDLYAQKFDPEKIEKSGEAVLIAKNVALSDQYGSAGYSAGGGTLAYQLRTAASNPPVMRLDRRTRTRTAMPTLAGANLDLARDDSRIALQRMDSEHNTPDVWVGDLARGAMTRISFDPAADFGPVWSPDNKFVVYGGLRNGAAALLRKLASGAGSEEVLARFPALGESPVGAVTEVIDWTRDGRTLITEMSKDGEGQNIGTIDLTTPKLTPSPIIATPFNEFSARISPDGKWIAYVSAESGTRQVYVQSFPPTGAKAQVSIESGESPRWRGDSREIFFCDRDKSIQAAAFTPRGTDPEVASPTPILDGASADYVVTSDGNTFYASMSRTNTAQPVHVVTNWTNGLR